MSSLRQALKKKKEAEEENLIPADLEPPKLVRQTGQSSSSNPFTIDIDEEECPRYLIVSDTVIPVNVKETVGLEFVYFNSGFINRSPKDLYERKNKICNIWVNIHIKSGKEWVERYGALSKGFFEPIVVYKGNKRQKFIKQVSNALDCKVVKYKNLRKIIELDGNDLLENMTSSIHINDPVGRLCGLLGFSKNLNSKN